MWFEVSATVAQRLTFFLPFPSRLSPIPLLFASSRRLPSYPLTASLHLCLISSTSQRDQTIRIWDLPSATCTKVLTGHEGSVLCLQSDSKVLVSGSSDSRILVWDMVGEEGTGKGQWEVKMSLVGHNMGVLDLCFDEDWIVSCSKVCRWLRFVRSGER